MTIDPYLALSAILAGGAVALNGFLGLREARASRHWPTVEGVILESGIASAVLRERGPVVPRVRYRYMVDGQELIGERIDFRRYRYGWSAERAAYNYPVGDRVAVHYNPQSPEQAVLNPATGGRFILIAGIGSLFAALGLAAMGGLFGSPP